MLKRGVVIRHLILPGRLAEAKRVMDWVSGHFAPGEVLFSLMSQYTPWGDLSRTPELNRRLRRGEMESAIAYMQNLGLPGFWHKIKALLREVFCLAHNDGALPKLLRFV